MSNQNKFKIHTNKKKYRSYKKKYNKYDCTKVKIDNLPDTITKKKINEFLQPYNDPNRERTWGRIGSIYIPPHSRKYKTCYAIIEFLPDPNVGQSHLQDAKDFVEALDRTGFGHQILRVNILEN